MPTPESFNSFQSQGAFFAFASTINALNGHLHHCYEEKFTGQLDLKIQTSQAMPWSLYFEQGHLVWGDGGVHPIRRWYRHLSRQCSAEVLATINEAASQIQPGNYPFLITLLLEKMQQQNVKEIVTGMLAEILFDLYQHWSQHQYSSTLQLKFNYIQLGRYKVPAVVSVNFIRLQAMQEWQEWQHTKLEKYSPNHAPSILDAEILQKRVLPSTYQKLAMTMDGKQTLRDLAAKSNKNVLTVTKSLLPYIQQGLVKLSEVEDLKPSAYLTAPIALPSLTLPVTSIRPDPEAPLIAYIDDYKVDGQIMNRILTQMGYRFIHIQDPMQALPLLLQRKPELIFLDLVMPIINGYETCAQIRRVSRFKETPIIILTSNDGIVDRVRAKIVGSTGFLAKPIEPAKVQAILQKYLPQFFKGSCSTPSLSDKEIWVHSTNAMRGNRDRE